MSSSEPKRYSFVDPVNEFYRETPQTPTMEGSYSKKNESHSSEPDVKIMPERFNKIQNGAFEPNGKAVGNNKTEPEEIGGGSR